MPAHAAAAHGCTRQWQTSNSTQTDVCPYVSPDTSQWASVHRGSTRSYERDHRMASHQLVGLRTRLTHASTGGCRTRAYGKPDPGTSLGATAHRLYADTSPPDTSQFNRLRHRGGGGWLGGGGSTRARGHQTGQAKGC